MRVLKSANHVTLRINNGIFIVTSTANRFNQIQTSNAVVALEFYSKMFA